MNNFNDYDNILCKKDLIANGQICFIKDEYYIYRENLGNVIDLFGCCIYGETSDRYPYYLTKKDLLGHFYTKNEIRKIKLNKIYEEAES